MDDKAKDLNQEKAKCDHVKTHGQSEVSRSGDPVERGGKRWSLLRDHKTNLRSIQKHFDFNLCEVRSDLKDLNKEIKWLNLHLKDYYSCSVRCGLKGVNTTGEQITALV